MYSIVPFAGASNMPYSSTPNFADPLDYGHRFDGLHSVNTSFVPYGAVGFSSAMHGPFGYTPQPSAHFGQYAFGAASYGADSFGTFRNNGYDLIDASNSNYTAIDEPSQIEEQKYVLPSAKKENRD